MPGPRDTTIAMGYSFHKPERHLEYAVAIAIVELSVLFERESPAFLKNPDRH